MIIIKIVIMIVVISFLMIKNNDTDNDGRNNT